ncbi:MAG: ABC transporter permease [Trueperaceae bacterium]
MNPVPNARPALDDRPGGSKEAIAARAARRLKSKRQEGGLATALRFVSYGSLLVLWIIGSRAMGEVLPGPLEVLGFVGREIENGRLAFHVWITTRRVLIAFAIALTAGVALGALMGRSKRADDLLQGWLIVTLTVPRILLFVVAYLIAGLNDRALIVALVITVLPTIVVTIREGTRALDGGLIEMARAFRRSNVQVWKSVILPQLMPFVVGTARGALALSWKMVVLGELLGRTSGVGYQISFYFQFFNMRGILAYGVTMMVLLALIDLVLMGWLQRRAFRWRAPIKVGSVG